ALLHHAPIDIGVGIAGDEDENLGWIAEAVIPRCDPVEDGAGNVGQEYEPERKSPIEVEPEVARYLDWIHLDPGHSKLSRPIDRPPASGNRQRGLDRAKRGGPR